MRFNSVLGAFFFILFATIVAAVIFLQTKSFGRLMTRVVSDIAQKKAATKVEIKSVELSVFPPGIEFNRVRVQKRFSSDEYFRSELGKLGFYIGLIELEEKRLTLGEIRVSDSVIEYTYPKKKDEPELKEIPKDVIDNIFEFTNFSPIRVDTLLIENSKIFANWDVVEAKRVKIFKKNENFMLRLHVANVRPVQDKDLSIDEIWGDVEIGRNDAKIYKIKIQHDVQSFLMQGEVKNYPLLKKAEFKLSGEALLHLKNLKNEVPVPSVLNFESGLARISFQSNFKEDKLNGDAQFSINHLESNFIFADEIAGKIRFADSKIELNELDFSYKQEKIKLTKPTVIANLKTKNYLPAPIEGHLSNVHLNNVLRILGPALNPLKGELNGNLVFNFNKGDYYFSPKNHFLVKNLALVIGEDKPFTVFHVKKADLMNSEFNIINNEFQMISSITLANSKFDLNGFINSKELNFTANDAKVDLLDFGNIAQLGVKGKGEIDLGVSGSIDDTVIDFEGLTNGFEILGYKFGKAQKQMSISLKDREVIIHSFDSILGSTKLTGSGAVNYGTLDMALDIKSQLAYYQDLNQILEPIFSKMDFLPPDFDFNAKVDASVFGKANLNDLRIRSAVNFKDFHAYGESVNSGEFVIGMKDQVISLENLEAQKSGGTIQGDYNFNLKNRFMKMNYTCDNIPFDSLHLSKLLNLNLQGDISGTLRGDGTTSDYNLNFIGKMYDTRTGAYRFDDSNFDVRIYPNRVAGKVNLLGQIINSKFDYSMNRKNSSLLNLKVNTNQIKPFLVAFLGQHIESEEIRGKFQFDLDAKFDSDFSKLNLEATLRQFEFLHSDFSVSHSANSPQFIVENGRVKKWNLNIKDTDFNTISKGEGVFGKNVNITHEINLSSKIMEILIAPILSAEGFLTNKIKISGTGNNYDVYIFSRGADLNLTIEAMPFPLNNLSYSLDYINNRLVIQDLKTNLDNGTVGIKGDVFFDQDDPDVNLRYVLDRAEIPVLTKSVVNISGEGIILGNNRPYNVGGEILVNKAQIINELSDFTSKTNTIGNVRFLPKNQESAIEKLINLNLIVKAENPVRVTNSLMDIALKGELNLIGSPLRPRAEGHVFSPPNSSRIFFKNNEYFITNADINFSNKKEITNPDFDIQAWTLISNFRVYPKAYGDLEKFSFDLTSEPALSRNSIFSLIAFGYPDELQNSLDPKEQQKLSQIGVGSFVFDRFKVSDILNKQFGLQVNLGTVLEQSQSSMLSGRSQEGQGTLGRVRSATKIELKKRLNEATTLSVSSTMGGDIGQRQSMNLTYGLNKQVQLEGVYEVRTNADGQEDVIDNSIGGDLKFRWTFK